MIESHIISRGLITAIAVVYGLLLGGPPAQSQQVNTAEEIKSAFIFNFIKFIEWPGAVFSSPDSPLLVCAVNGESLNGELNELQGRVASGRPIQVRHIAQLIYGTIDNSADCDVIFFGRSGIEYFAGSDYRRLPPHILTIGDSEGLAQAGAMINLYDERRQVRFEINLDTVRNSTLRFSPDLLSLADIVERAPE